MASLEADLGVITEARHRQRRRRTAIAVGLLVAAIAAVIAATYPRDAGAPIPATTSSAALTAPGRVFSQSPYMGVACPVANSIACDRVGLAVWLRRPAVAVTATIAGAPLKLNWGGDRSPGFALRHDPTPRTAFDGFLQPAGIVARLRVKPEPGTSTWLGSGTPTPFVALRIDYGHGRIVLTRLRLPLSAGWG
jgi:hypothetical protein